VVPEQQFQHIQLMALVRNLQTHWHQVEAAEAIQEQQETKTHLMVVLAAAEVGRFRTLLVPQHKKAHSTVLVMETMAENH
jgi:hypothetical protein